MTCKIIVPKSVESTEIRKTLITVRRASRGCARNTAAEYLPKHPSTGVDITSSLPYALDFGDASTKTLFLTEKHQHIRSLFDIKVILGK